MAATIIPILNIALQAEPELLALVQAARKIGQKYPQLTAAQIATVVEQAVSQSDPGFDSVIQKVAVDQGKATVQTPPVPAAPPPPAA